MAAAPPASSELREEVIRLGANIPDGNPNDSPPPPIQPPSWTQQIVADGAVANTPAGIGLAAADQRLVLPAPDNEQFRAPIIAGSVCLKVAPPSVGSMLRTHPQATDDMLLHMREEHLANS